MAISDVQFRISQIRAMVTPPTAAPMSPTRTSGTTAAATSPATQFKAALDQAVASAGTNTDGAIAPTKGRVTSEFGSRWGKHHDGIDIAAGTGTTVRAVAGGVVKKAEWYGGYGKAVIVDHGDGTETLYAHNSKLDVKVGERVRAGQQLSEVGTTGDSTGPHLHFEVKVNDKKINPRTWLEKRGVAL